MSWLCIKQSVRLIAIIVIVLAHGISCNTALVKGGQISSILENIEPHQWRSFLLPHLLPAEKRASRGGVLTRKRYTLKGRHRETHTLTGTKSYPYFSHRNCQKQTLSVLPYVYSNQCKCSPPPGEKLFALKKKMYRIYTY